MRRYMQYEPFNIYLFEATEWQHPVHTHSYFEIIFIRSGRGRHNINGNIFDYANGDVFLLGPKDYHSFEILEPTLFCYIRFTENFVHNQTPVQAPGLSNAIAYLLNTPYQAGGSIVTDKKEQENLEHLLVVLLEEYNHRYEDSYNLIMTGIMKAILGILGRHAHGRAAVKRPYLIQDILLYIQQQILQPENLRIDHLATKFNYSAGYLSVYFKKQTGESLQQYILKHKLKLVENRLLFSTLSISQITYEFGFTDASHLNKLFKKYYGMGPQAFRQKVLQE